MLTSSSGSRPGMGTERSTNDQGPIECQGPSPSGPGDPDGHRVRVYGLWRVRQFEQGTGSSLVHTPVRAVMLVWDTLAVRRPRGRVAG